MLLAISSDPTPLDATAPHRGRSSFNQPKSVPPVPNVLKSLHHSY